MARSSTPTLVRNGTVNAGRGIAPRPTGAVITISPITGARARARRERQPVSSRRAVVGERDEHDQERESDERGDEGERPLPTRSLGRHVADGPPITVATPSPG